MRLTVEEQCSLCNGSFSVSQTKIVCSSCSEGIKDKYYNEGYLRGLEDTKFMILVVRKHLTETQQIPGTMDNSEKAWFERGGNATLTGMDKLIKEAMDKKIGQKKIE